MFTKIVVDGIDHDALSLAETLLAEDGTLVLADGGAAALRRRAAEEDADLIVIGSAHALGLAPALRCPVAIAPRRYGQGTGRPTVLGVGYDGSPDADAALALADRLATALHGRVHVRVVAEVLAPSAADPAFRDCDAIERRARVLLRRTCERLGAPAAGDVVCGAPGDALQALSQDVDVLVIGAPDAAPRRRLIPASPALRLVQHAGCPLVIVPRGLRVEAGRSQESPPRRVGVHAS